MVDEPRALQQVEEQARALTREIVPHGRVSPFRGDVLVASGVGSRGWAVAAAVWLHAIPAPKPSARAPQRIGIQESDYARLGLVALAGEGGLHGRHRIRTVEIPAIPIEKKASDVLGRRTTSVSAEKVDDTVDQLCHAAGLCCRRREGAYLGPAENPRPLRAPRARGRCHHRSPRRSVVRIGSAAEIRSRE